MITTPFSGVWGFPWHGKCKGGEIDGYAKTFNQPPNGNAWLIDMGLHSISLTTEEAAEATANDYNWRNYALISGGQVYDTALPSDSFIHVDEDNKCWLVTLAYSYPASNTLRITASIKRFGVFGFGEASAITKTSDVSCENIELGGYSSREGWLNDVWTNGGKVLVGVGLITGSGSTTIRDLFSVVELLISGSGSSDGSTLTISASEIIGNSDLSPGSFVINPTNYVTDVEPFISGSLYASTAPAVIDIYEIVHTCQIGDPADTIESRRFYSASEADKDYFWYGDSPTGYGGGMSVPDYESSGAIYAKESFYSSAGIAKVLRIKYEVTTENHITGFDGPYCSGFRYTYCNQLPTNNAITWNDKYLAGSTKKTLSVLVNSDVIDDIGTIEFWTGFQHSLSELLLDSGHTSTITPTGTELTGSLAGHFDEETDIFDESKFSVLLGKWRYKITPSTNLISTSTGKYLGLQAINAKASALYFATASDSARNYGSIATPLGTKTTILTPSGNLYFAWQRKTGDFVFDDVPVCYV